MTQFLNNADSLEWARNAHGVPAEAKSFILGGNEDSPTYLEYFLESMPDNDAVGVKHIVSTACGEVLVEEV